MDCMPACLRRKISLLWIGSVLLLALALLPGGIAACLAQEAAHPAAPEDVLVLSNGDTLHGHFVRAVDGKVIFHTDPLGDVTLDWDKIHSLRTQETFAVVDKSVKLLGKKLRQPIPVGTLTVENGEIVVQPEEGPALAPVSVKQTAFIVKQAAVDHVRCRCQNILSGWSGAATAGATVVTATQKQYTVTGGIRLERVIPEASWLKPRNRTSLSFTGSFGKIIQPGYFSAGAYVPETVTKSAIYHADAERDEYFSGRFFALAQTAFDHNYSQSLDLQQVYGAGIGWTVLKTPRQEADLKATLQYEKQQFIPSLTGAPAPSPNQNLVGSTFAADYVLHLRLLALSQGVAYLPAYNHMHAYSANETNSVTFPAYKNLSFSVGTIDSYLNNPPTSEPPTRRNSFQFTMGLSYSIKPRH